MLSTYYKTKEALIHGLFEIKSTYNELKNNMDALQILGNHIDDINTKETNLSIFSITNEMITNLYIISKVKSEYSWSNKFHVWIKTINHKISKKFETSIHYNQSGITLDHFISESGILSKDRYLGLILKEDFSGKYTFDDKKGKDFIKYSTFSNDVRPVNLGDPIDLVLYNKSVSISGTLNKALIKTHKIINKCVEKQTKELKAALTTDIGTDSTTLVFYIEEVRNIDNERYSIVRILSKNKEEFLVARKLIHTFPNSDSRKAYINYKNIFKFTNHQYLNGCNFDLSLIPHELNDVGRYGIVQQVNYRDNVVFISQDPKVVPETDVLNELTDVLNQYSHEIILNGLCINWENISNPKETPEPFCIQRDKTLSDVLDQCKRTIDEFKYISKKEKVVDGCFKITDKIQFNSETGKVSYNDFSITIPNEYVKAGILESFRLYIKGFYDGTMTEEAILNQILQDIFHRFEHLINIGHKENTTIPININDAINVNLDIKLSHNKSSLIYLNDIRFNKDEITNVIREITCYRSQAEADMFISNIGKVGLATYIGITSGYIFNNRLYKFRKVGRGKYKLILDTIEIDIVSKKLVNTLYDNFKQPIYASKINGVLETSISSTFDFIKYQFLIDSAYAEFKKKSEEILDKKIKDVDGQKVKYILDGKILESIKLTGNSTREYIIAYNQSGSWVFIDPVKEKEDLYKAGKYVCMVDQSAIKSNIGSDTLIAKLLAIKNDSVIAKNIYNLKDELISGDNDNEENNN